MFSIIELQTTDGITVHNYFTADTKEQAMSKYHEILMYAAVSSVKKHVCVVMDDEGTRIAKECYTHYIQSESEDTNNA